MFCRTERFEFPLGVFRQVRGTVFTFRGGKRNVSGKAGRTGFYAGRIAKDGDASFCGNLFVGYDYQKVNNKHKYDKVDDCGYKRPEIQKGGLVSV